MNSMSSTVFGSQLPNHWKDNVASEPQSQARNNPTNGRPDLARRLYRRPLKIAGLLDVRTQNRFMEARLRNRLVSQASFDVALFRPIAIRPGMQVTARTVLDAMRPGFPCGLTVDAALSRTRMPAACFARQIAYYVMVRGLNFSRAKVGKRFGVDHSTVIHGLSLVEARIASGALNDPIPVLLPREEPQP